MQPDFFGMYPERAFMKVAGRMTLEGGGGKGGSAPPPPDYTGAARETAAGNKEASRKSRSPEEDEDEAQQPDLEHPDIAFRAHPVTRGSRPWSVVPVGVLDSLVVGRGVVHQEVGEGVR